MARKKLALVLASFGSTQEQEEDFIESIKSKLRIQHPEMEIFTAVTSKVVATSRRRKGQAANALAQVLSELSGNGYTHVAVQSLHVVPGMEFDMLSDITKRFSHMPKGIIRTVIGPPLINDDMHAERVANILMEDLPKERKVEDAVIFIGHGAKHPAGTLAYPALQAYFWRRDPNIFVGTVEGSLDAESTLNMLQKGGVKKVWLVPLLAYYGVHVTEDIFGEEKSWLSLFEKSGLTCVPSKITLLARPLLVDIWVEHAINALESLHE